MKASSSIRPDVLGRLLAIPSLLDVFSDIAGIALFLQSALREVPGISDLAIDMEGVCYPTSLVDARPPVPQPPLHLSRSPPPPAGSPISCRRMRLATNRQHYGDLLLVIDDLDQFILYEPYVCNIANIVATVLENRAFLHNLQTTNSRLTEVLNHLEQRVQERTSLLSAEIARREDLETALRASEEKYRNLLTTTSEGFWLLDAAMNLSEVNQALCTMLGYTQAELLGKSLIDLVDEADRSMFMEQLAHVPVTNHRHYELVLITSQGNKLHTSVHATTIRNARRDVQGSFAFITDITKRKRAEAALKQLNQELEQRVQERTQSLEQQAEQERLLRFSIQNIHQSLNFEEILTIVLSETRQTLQVDRVSIYQFSADWSGRFVAESLEEGWNRFGREELQLIGAGTSLQVNTEERYDQNEVRVVNDIYTAGLDSCQIESLEQFQLRAYVIIPIFVDDQLWGFLAVCQHRGAREWQSWEITLLQQISLQLAIALRQSQLYQAAQMQVETLEKLNHLKDDFLSTVSHELRSPLASIKMAIQMLELKLSQPQTQDERLTQYIQILKTSCTQELSLINDLLDLQRLEAGKQGLEIESIDLNQWLPAMIEPFATRAQEYEQQLIIELPRNLPIITTDLHSLKRIVTELLHNACKYTPPGEQIKLAVWVRDEGLHMQVSNSGVELPPETLPHLFEKFYRVTGTDRWKQGGTGLGLALVKRLVEHLNGTIAVNSENSLIWFTLRLPLTLQVPALLGTEGVT